MRIVPENKRSVQVGQEFGRLSVIGVPFYARQSSRLARQFAVCDCSCGTTVVVRCDGLTSNAVLSCGCFHSDKMREVGKSLTTHGRLPRRLWNLFCSMHQRCRDPKTQSFRYYGGRGIRVCDEWKDFVAFRDWALGNGYDEKLSIDRIDSSGNYEPSNCRWVTMRTQQNNRRDNRIVNAFGESKTIAEWSRDPRCAVSYTTLLGRIRSGKSPEESLVTTV